METWKQKQQNQKESLKLGGETSLFINLSASSYRRTLQKKLELSYIADTSLFINLSNLNNTHNPSS